MSPSTYLLTVAVHASALSLMALVMVVFVRNPRARSVFALASLVGIACLSWLTPLRPASGESFVVPIPVASRTLPVQSKPTPSEPPPAGAVVHLIESAPSPASPFNQIQPGSLLIALWIAGILVGTGFFIGSIRNMKRWGNSLVLPDDSQWTILQNALPRELPRNAFRICAGDASPCVSGFRAPLVVIPGHLLNPSKSRELRWALRHEISHLEGQDSRWVFAAAAVRVLFWWNPLIHALGRIWSNTREQVCDRTAAVSEDERSGYGKFLVSVAAGRQATRPLTLAMTRTGLARKLERRISILLKSPPEIPERVSRIQSLTGSLAFMAILAATSTLAVGGKGPAEPAPGVMTLDEILNPPSRLLVTMAIVRSSKPLLQPDEVLTEPELQARINERIKDIQELLPICQEAETGSRMSWSQSNVIRSDAALSTELPWDVNSSLSPFLGWAVGWNGHAEDDAAHLSINAAYAFVPGKHLAPRLVPSDAIPWN